MVESHMQREFWNLHCHELGSFSSFHSELFHYMFSCLCGNLNIVCLDETAQIA
jgi:hypothetical protein